MPIFKRRKPGRTIVTILLSILIAVLLFAVGNMVISQMNNKVPSFFGYSFMNVISTSMEPLVPENTFILIKQIDPHDLVTGDVITFYSQDPGIRGFPNTHRIYSIDNTGTSPVFTTKGDANAIADKYTVNSSDVIGVYVGNVITLGKYGKIFQSKATIFILLVIPAAVLFIIELANFSKASKAEKKEGESVQQEVKDDKRSADQE